MKFIIQKNTLLECLKICCDVIDTTSLNPIGDCVLINANTTQIQFKAFSTTTAIQTHTNQGFTTQKEGNALIKGRLLYNIISKIHNTEITLEIVDSSVLRITIPNFTSDVNLCELNLFPTLNFNYESWPKVEISNTFFKNVIKKITTCSTTTENKNVACNSVLIDSSNLPNTIEATGTEAHHLAYFKQEYQGPQFKIILNNQTIKHLEPFLNNPTITCFINNKNILFNTQNTAMLMRTVEGEYPNLSKPLQTQNPHKIILKTNILINAIDKATTLTSFDKKPAIQFGVNANTLKITARSIECGSTFEEINITNSTNVQVSFTFNAKYLLDLLKNIDTENVVMEFSTEHKPVIIKEENNPNYTSLILPIMGL